MVVGGMCGGRGACMVVQWGACVVAGGACVGYDEIWSMSGRYASYWNAFLSYFNFRLFTGFDQGAIEHLHYVYRTTLIQYTYLIHNAYLTLQL